MAMNNGINTTCQLADRCKISFIRSSSPGVTQSDTESPRREHRYGRYGHAGGPLHGGSRIGSFDSRQSRVSRQSVCLFCSCVCLFCLGGGQRPLKRHRLTCSAKMCKSRVPKIRELKKRSRAKASMLWGCSFRLKQKTCVGKMYFCHWSS